MENTLKEFYNSQVIKKDSYDKFSYHLYTQFRGIDFRNKRVLEIGCGKGFTSLYLSIVKKAGQIVAIDESRGEGSEAGIIDHLSTACSKLGIDNIKPIKSDIMDYQTKDKFDIIVSNNAMHHVCEHGLLRIDKRAREKYYNIFCHVRNLLHGNGLLLIHEYSRLSIFRYIPIKKFECITWSMHPTKAEWIDVLRNSGFTDVIYNYSVPYPLRKFERWLQFPPIHFLYYPSFYIKAKA